MISPILGDNRGIICRCLSVWSLSKTGETNGMTKRFQRENLTFTSSKIPLLWLYSLGKSPWPAFYMSPDYPQRLLFPLNTQSRCNECHNFGIVSLKKSVKGTGFASAYNWTWNNISTIVSYKIVWNKDYEMLPIVDKYYPNKRNKYLKVVKGILIIYIYILIIKHIEFSIKLIIRGKQ